jgi:pyruvate ferredoxin oxidoreductase gamma subunit
VEDLKKILAAPNAHLYSINARRIALDVLGRPIYNTAMLGALIRIVPLTSLESITEVVKLRFPGTLGEKNVEAVKRAFEEVADN